MHACMYDSNNNTGTEGTKSRGNTDESSYYLVRYNNDTHTLKHDAIYAFST